MIAGKKWGGNKEFLIKIANSTIRSLIENGSLACGTAPPSTFLFLDVIYNSAIRLSLGAFPTTPRSSLLCEDNVDSLLTKRNLEIIKYCSKMSFYSTYPNKKDLPLN